MLPLDVLVEKFVRIDSWLYPAYNTSYIYIYVYAQYVRTRVCVCVISACVVIYKKIFILKKHPDTYDYTSMYVLYMYISRDGGEE